jgi:hypothetical protein
MNKQIDRHKQLAVWVAQKAEPAHNEALRTWASTLLTIRVSDLPARQKASEALAATRNGKVIWPLLKLLARETRRLGWEERSPAERVGMSAAAATALTFGGAQAGIAALGGAVAVPLWIVFGAGSMFAKHLYDELNRAAAQGASNGTRSMKDTEKADE